MSEFLTISEAAHFLGVSAETLRRWDRSGRLVATRRPGSNRRYYARQDLAEFHLDYARSETSSSGRQSIFVTALPDIEANEGLREPQREAHRAVREHFEQLSGPAMLVIPVGCGKSGLISVLPFGIATGRVLVIAPNLTIRDGLAEALDIASTECFWAKTRVLPNFQHGPYTAVLDGKDANIHDCVESDFVVTNIQQLASSADRWLPQFPPDFFDMVIIDEGHHSAAESWRKVLRRFPEAKVVSLTATPFRTDRQELPGEIVYRYSFANAMLSGYIKPIRRRSAAPSELYFTATGDRRYTLEEVLELSEEAWFRRSVALSPECNRHIVEASIAECNLMRQRTGTHHQIIASACSIDHARQVRSIYEECGYRAAAISSDLDPDEQERILRRLRDHNLDCIVQVQMLGEGFDHPALSVAAIFRPYRSLAPYIQFVGRIMRVIHQNEPDHPDNRGVIVTHVGLNNEERWQDFRELDLDDQDLVAGWNEAGADEAGPSEENGQSGEPRRFDQLRLVQGEFISHFLDGDFLDLTDDRVFDEVLSREVMPGVTLGSVLTGQEQREALRQSLIERQRELEPSPDYSEIPVSPQRRRQEARRRLAERSNAVAARILKDLGLAAQSRDLARLSRRGNQSNRQAAIALMHERVNNFIGIDPGQRSEITGDQAVAAINQLDVLGDQLVAEYKALLGEHR
ncbi:MAG: DEAD/DEAH box helicase family protein [bacterium]|nr:DEAD/DEAH box helicase family protein [bacterium]